MKAGLGICVFMTLTILSMLVFTACDKDDSGDDSHPLIFESLTIEHDTIPVGGTARVIATASGKGLTYLWSATAGSLLGSGKEVIYTTDPCHAGEQIISCTVEDSKGDAETKTVKVFVAI